tara:strand:- start:4378 stop:5178 length:801 start_codon:yes stop_codon:yes gene_type:complete
MKTQYSNILATVIIVNFNNEKFLNSCLNSVLNQSHKAKQIIVVDDNSTDKSVEVLKKYKNKITLLVNKKKTKHGSYNQINCYYKGYLKSKGKYIFFLDSDDYFKKNKIKFVVEYFEKNQKLNLIFDLPILKFINKIVKKEFFQKKLFFSSWPRFTSQSCISVRRSYLKELFNFSKVKKFETIWFDFRIACYCFLKEGKINIFKKYLTFYRQLDNSASSKFKLMSKIWWYRRNQAHNFMSYLSKRLKKKDKFTLDKFLTKFVKLFNE